MSTYKNLIGKDVKFLSTDPDNEQAEGQIWYNSTAGVFKNAITNTAFSAGASLSTSRSDFRGTFGTQSAFKGAGGFTTFPPGNTPAITNVEDYDGTGFSTATALPLATRNQAGGGTQTAGWVAGGRRYPTSPSDKTDKTQEWDGSSWSEGGNLGSAKYGNSGTGTATAGLSSGGYNTTNLNETEEYDGSSWSEQNNMGTARYRTAATGTQTATILFGGTVYPGSPQQVNNVEEYDGTSWTALTNLPAVNGMAYSFGTTTDAIVTGGASGPGPAVNTTLQWDGTSYTSFPNLATARYNGGDGATTSSTAGLVVGGYITAAVSTTEEYNRSVNVITGAAWASGGNLGTARYKISSANNGTQTAALGFGGRASSGDTARDLSEEYNGSSWSEGNNLNNATRGAVGAGTQTAGLRAGGYDGGPAEQDNTEEYDGTSWSNANDMPANMRLGAGCGTQTAAVAFGGLSSPLSDKAVEYDGTNWTVGGTMNTGRYYLAGFGIQTAAVAAGGNSKDDTEEYDGTSWTSVNDVTSGNTQGAAAGGILTAGLFFGGTRTSIPENTNVALTYDGTNYITTAAMSTARVALGGTSGGSNTAGLAFGGSAPPSTNATEEFTGETSELNVKTITTS